MGFGLRDSDWQEPDEGPEPKTCGGCINWLQLYDGGHGACYREYQKHFEGRPVKLAMLVDWLWNNDRDGACEACPNYREAE